MWPMNHKGQWGIVRAFLLLCVTALFVAKPRAAKAQTYPAPIQCPAPSSFPRRIPVRFDPGLLSARGFNPDDFRAAVIRAIHVWNEEGRAPFTLEWGGDIPIGGNPLAGQITIQHTDRGACTQGDALALASRNDYFCNGYGPATVVFNLLRCPKNTGSIPWAPGIADGSEHSYEGTLVHELGHVLLGVIDVYGSFGTCDPTGIMCGYSFPGPEARRLHLYPIDQNTARVVYTPPPGQPDSEGSSLRVRRLDPFQSSWIASVDLPNVSSTIGPALSRRTTGDDRPSFVLFSPNRGGPAVIEARAYSSTPISTYGPPPNLTTNDSLRFWPRVAVSIYGEMFATWINCTNITAGCSVFVGYNDTPSVSSTWIVSQLPSVATFAPAAVAYDQNRDSFVAVVVDAGDLRPRTTWTPAYRPNYALTALASGQATAWSQRIRFVGGLVFEPELANEGQYALASNLAAFPGRVALGRSTVQFDSASNSYRLAEPVAMTAGTLIETPRHFDTARFGSFPALTMVWLRGDGAGGLSFALAGGPGIDFLPADNSLSLSDLRAISSVSVSSDLGYDDSAFAVGFSAY